MCVYLNVDETDLLRKDADKNGFFIYILPKVENQRKKKKSVFICVFAVANPFYPRLNFNTNKIEFIALIVH